MVREFSKYFFSKLLINQWEDFTKLHFIWSIFIDEACAQDQHFAVPNNQMQPGLHLS